MQSDITESAKEAGTATLMQLYIMNQARRRFKEARVAEERRRRGGEGVGNAMPMSENQKDR